MIHPTINNLKGSKMIGLSRSEQKDVGLMKNQMEQH